MEISFVFQEHPHDEVWEEYAFDRLTPEVTAKLEEHLLLCERCRNTLTATDLFIQSMKAASVEPAPAQSRLRWPKLPAGILEFNPKHFASATAVATALLIAFLLIGPGRGLWRQAAVSVASVAIPLESLRGAGAPTAQAPAKHPLDLSISQASVPASGVYRLEVVDSSGDSVWTGAAEAKNSRLLAHIDKGFRSGMYWVRLYAASDELLAEYGLNLE